MTDAFQTLTDNEWELMNAVWQHQPVTAREVANTISNDKNWAYNTVKTMLDRLVSKQILTVEKHDRRNLYVALLSQNEARRTATHSLLDKAFAGAARSMMHCMIDDRQLSRTDREQLIDMLKYIDDSHD